MSHKSAVALLLAMAAIAISPSTPAAAPLSPAAGTTNSAGVTLFTRVQSKNGSVIRSTGQLRTFRPFQVARIRPTFGRNHVRPGRPLAHRKRPRRSRHVHVAGPVSPMLPPAIYEDSAHEFLPLSPDLCRYWEDRGVFVGDFEPCW